MSYAKTATHVYELEKYLCAHDPPSNPAVQLRFQPPQKASASGYRWHTWIGHSRRSGGDSVKSGVSVRVHAPVKSRSTIKTTARLFKIVARLEGGREVVLEELECGHDVSMTRGLRVASSGATLAFKYTDPSGERRRCRVRFTSAAQCRRIVEMLQACGATVASVSDASNTGIVEKGVHVEALSGPPAVIAAAERAPASAALLQFLPPWPRQPQIAGPLAPRPLDPECTAAILRALVDPRLGEVVRHVDALWETTGGSFFRAA